MHQCDIALRVIWLIFIHGVQINVPIFQLIQETLGQYFGTPYRLSFHT